MFDFLKTGGLAGMIMIGFCALFVILITAFKTYEMTMKKKFTTQGLTAILFFGSIAPLIGIIWQMTGMMQAFEAIEMAGDISLSLLVGGLKVSMYAPLFGLGVLFASAVLWFSLRWRIRAALK